MIQDIIIRLCSCVLFSLSCPEFDFHWGFPMLVLTQHFDDNWDIFELRSSELWFQNPDKKGMGNSYVERVTPPLNEKSK